MDLKQDKDCNSLFGIILTGTLYEFSYLLYVYTYLYFRATIGHQSRDTAFRFQDVY